MSSGRPRTSLWRAVRRAWRGSSRHAYTVLDTALVVSLADGAMNQAERDALLRLAERTDGALPRDWAGIERRIRAVFDERPLFDTTRRGIVDRLRGTPEAETALRNAALVAGSDGVLSETARALFDALAEELGVPRPQDLLHMPSPETRAKLRYLRTSFNAPSEPPHPALTEAIQNARGGETLRLLLVKLVALRAVLEIRFAGEEDREVRELGLVHPTDLGPVRIDGEIDVRGARYYVRVLAADEALHLGEAQRLTEFSGSLEPRDRLLLAHEGPLCLADFALTRALGKERMEAFTLPTGRHPP